MMLGNKHEGDDKMPRKILVTFGIVLIICSVLISAQAAEVPVDDEPAIQELVIRLLTPSYPGAPDIENTKIFVGTLPDEMPINLPTPEGARILGSMVKGEQWIEIVMDVNQTPEQVLDFYRENMATDNWSEIGGFEPIRGFAPAPGVDGITLCRGAWNQSVTINAYEVENGSTDVRLNVNTNPDRSPCRQSELLENWMKPLPKLVAPPDVEHFNGDFSGGGSIVSSTATLETDMNSTALEEYYADQLKEANWTYIESGQCGPVAWSTWKVVDEDDLKWNGQFIALEVPGTGKQRFVLLRLQTQDIQPCWAP